MGIVWLGVVAGSAIGITLAGVAAVLTLPEPPSENERARPTMTEGRALLLRLAAGCPSGWLRYPWGLTISAGAMALTVVSFMGLIDATLRMDWALIALCVSGLTLPTVWGIWVQTVEERFEPSSQPAPEGG